MATQKLTTLKVRHATAPGRYGDGNGLYLYVRPNGSRAWVLRYKRSGEKTRDMGLGSLASVSLAEARELASRAREQIRAGTDPIVARGAPVLERTVVRTFREVAEEYVRSQEPSWKNPIHRAQWRSTLERYAFPVLGDMPVAQITTADVRGVLSPIWNTKTETADRLRGRIERVLASAKALGLRTGENPAAWKENLANLLPPAAKLKKVRHHPSLPWEECPALMALLTNRDGDGAKALAFTILNAVRTNETLQAVWGELDLGERLWTIPAIRMKGKKDHRVPLSEGAMAVLKSLGGPSHPPSHYVFHDGNTSVPLSNATMAAVLDRLGMSHVTVHGFRASFRTWAAESSGAYREDIAEAALAHVKKDKTVAAYHRGELFDLRKSMMADWSKFLFPTEL